jgi:3-hydroxyacyl-[acyl-carrier-protein] dehydratase
MRYHFVDRFIEMIPGKSAKTVKNIAATEDVFTDHFPGFPVYPGALLIEVMAQSAGLLIQKTVSLRDGRRVLPILSIVKNAKFRSATLPGDSLIIDVVLDNCTADAAMINATIWCDGVKRAQAAIFFTLLDVSTLLGSDEVASLDTAATVLDRVNALRNNPGIARSQCDTL